MDKLIKDLIKNKNLDASLEYLDKETKIKLRDALLLNSVEKSRTNFYEFVKLMAPTLIVEGFVHGTHIKVIADELERVVRDIEFNNVQLLIKDPKKRKKMRKPRLQVFLPPRSMKSKLCSNLFPAWVLGVHPEWSIIAIGNSVKFAEANLGRYTREIVMSEEYRAIFPETIIKKNERSVGSWATTKNGKYHCNGANANVTGRGCHLLLCDDVIGEQQAFSTNERNRINEWYEPALRTRLHPTGGEVLINTRWHVEDLSGYLLDKDKGTNPWKVISIPAIVDEDAAKLLNKPVGTSYWPELWSYEHFIDLKTTWPASKFAALYMQNPIPAEGSIIKEEYFQMWALDEPPEVDYIVASFDTAMSEKEKADNSAFTVWGIFFQKNIGYNGFEYIQPNMILLDAQKGQWSFVELLEKCDEIQEKFDPNLFVVENKSSGIYLIRELRLKQIPVFEYLPDKGKTERTYACEPAFAAGRIWVPENRAFTTDLMVEMTNFPFYPKDDLHDTATQAIIWMRENLVIPNPGELGAEDEFGFEEDHQPKRKASYW